MSTTNQCNHPRVGVATAVIKDGNILIGRDTKKGKGIYGVPGGKWEVGESLVEGAAREVLEESGITCGNIKFLSIYELHNKEKHESWVTIQMTANYVSGEVRDLHNEGRMEWNWYTPEEALRLNLYEPDRALIERLVRNHDKF